MKKIVIAWVVCVLGLVGLLAWLGTSLLPAPAPKESSKTLINGRFSLVDASGSTITNASFPNRYLLVFFGFTHCPDICPTALLVIQNALNQLGSDADKVTPILITIDPERDTPKVMGEYVAHFGPRMVGLTGSVEQIQKVQNAYKVYSSKIETGSPLGYTMDHSSFMYLMGPDGKYITHFPSTIQDQQLKDALAKNLR